MKPIASATKHARTRSGAGRSLVAHTTTLRARPVSGPNSKSEIVQAVVAAVWPLIAEARVRPIIGARMPIQDAGEAHKKLVSGEVHGKIVLTV